MSFSRSRQLIPPWWENIAQIIKGFSLHLAIGQHREGEDKWHTCLWTGHQRAKSRCLFPRMVKYSFSLYFGAAQASQSLEISYFLDSGWKLQESRILSQVLWCYVFKSTSQDTDSMAFSCLHTEMIWHYAVCSVLPFLQTLDFKV